MLISDQYQFIFIHIPKTGGSSIRQAFKEIGITRTKLTRWQRFLSQLGLNKDYKTYRFRMHGELQSVEKNMPGDIFKQYTKFSVVRNPWDRLVSEYQYFKQGSEVHESVLKRYRHRWVNTVDNFTQFVHVKAERKDATQFYYLCNSAGELGTDVVLRQEYLNDDFARLCARLGLNCRLQRYNVTQHKSPVSDYFTQELHDFVEKHWHQDIELFNYQTSFI